MYLCTAILTLFHSNLKASINGKDIPEDIKARLLSLHEDNLLLKEQLKTTTEKLNKAKAVSEALVSNDGLFETLSLFSS